MILELSERYLDKCRYYNRSKVEHYNLYRNEDGLIKRVTTYDDEKWQKVNNIHEYYSQREDHMYKKYINTQENTEKETFHTGRRDCLKGRFSLLNQKSG